MNRVPHRALFMLLALVSFAFPIQAQVSFLQPPSYAGGGGTFVADFNNDGKLDLLTSDGTMNLGNADGTFTPGTNVSLPGGFSALAVADFNGDGKLDVLEQDASKGALLILLGNGDGTFQAPLSTPIGAVLWPLAAVDLNGDAEDDVVGVSGSLLIVYISNGDGTFKSGVPYNLGVTPTGSPSLSVGDFNGDSETDVAVSIGGIGAGGEELVFLGNGDGTFQSTPKTSSGLSDPASVIVGDFSGDGKIDLAIVCNVSCGAQERVFLLLGKGDGTFQSPAALFSVYGQSVLAAADFNGDGRLDLVVEQDPTVLQIYLQNIDGTFSNDNSYVMTMPSPYYGTAFYTGIAIADFNHDGKLDLGAENGVLLGNGDGSFEGIQLGTIPASLPTAAVVGDFEKNGRMDAAAVSGTGLYILRNNGQGNLSLLHTYTLQQPGHGIATAEFNGDGKLDLVVFGMDSITSDWNYSVLLGNGDGSFQSPVYYPQGVAAGSYSLQSVVADFNNDHKPDIALVTGNATQSLAILLGNADGTFATPVYYFVGNSANSLTIADFNSDGNLDIAAPGTSGEGILYGKGDGAFQPIVFPASLNGFYASNTADINSDGKPDLIGGHQIALGNGDGTFRVLTSPLQNAASGIADFNGDGKLDFFEMEMGTTPHPVATGIQLGNGDGTFSPFLRAPTNGLLWSSFYADMNGDGRTDIVFFWNLAGSVTFSVGGLGVILNTTPTGFELTAGTLSPAPLTAGNSATSTINALSNFGFNTAATLSCSGLPSGALCEFSPPSIAGSSGKATLTITTNASTAAGTYPIQITGTAGLVTSSTSSLLIVQAAPDFSLSPTSPPSETITAGQTASFSLNLTSSGGLSGTLNFSCAITPTVTKGPTCNLPASVQISGTGPQSVSVTVGTTATTTTSAFLDLRYPRAGLRLLWISALLGMVLLFARSHKRMSAFSLSIAIMGAVSLLGCGGSSSHTTIQGTPAGTYTVTVTATSGNLNHNSVLRVMVQ